MNTTSSDLLVSASDDTDIKLHSLQNSTSVYVNAFIALHSTAVCQACALQVSEWSAC